MHLCFHVRISHTVWHFQPSLWGVPTAMVFNGAWLINMLCGFPVVPEYCPSIQPSHESKDTEFTLNSKQNILQALLNHGCGPQRCHPRVEFLQKCHHLGGGLCLNSYMNFWSKMKSFLQKLPRYTGVAPIRSKFGSKSQVGIALQDRTHH